jgi:subtilisin family serine protease
MPVNTKRTLRTTVLAVTFTAAVATAGGLVANPATGAPNVRPGHYIVVLKHGASVSSATPKGVAPDTVYSHALTGYAASMSTSTAAALRTNPNVKTVVPDTRVTAAPGRVQVSSASSSTEIAPFGVVRIGTLRSKTAKIDGRDQRVDANIAVVDTGVDQTHPDLNYVGGTNCINAPGGPGVDPSGHGTLVAGVAAAIDNQFGVVGVAPGARIWSVRVLDQNGDGTESGVLCGLDWVAAHANRLEVVNFSIRIDGTDTANCGYADGDVVHQTICKIEAGGVTFVAAAGNSAVDAQNTLAAAYDDVITVSAMADYDGKPGGLAPDDPACAGQGQDDHLATFSNFGHDIDLAAPGVCIRSTYPVALCPQPVTQCYATVSGTSFAAPHVAGAAALYLARHTDAQPPAVQRALIQAAEPGPLPGDPDQYPEGVVNVAGF